MTSLETQEDKTVCLAVTCEGRSQGGLGKPPGFLPFGNTSKTHSRNQELNLEKRSSLRGRSGRTWARRTEACQCRPSSHERVVAGKPGWFLEWQPQSVAAPENVHETQVLRLVGGTQLWWNRPSGILNSSQM